MQRGREERNLKRYFIWIFGAYKLGMERSAQSLYGSRFTQPDHARQRDETVENYENERIMRYCRRLKGYETLSSFLD